MLKWDQELYGIGIEDIDFQHEKLFELLNDLRNRFNTDRKGDGVSQAIIKLVEYGNEHFAFEEAFLDSIKFPHAKAHKMLHSGFNRKIKDYLLRMRSGKLVSYLEIFAFLQGWIQNHVARDDTRYAEFYRKFANTRKEQGTPV
jgi:hemerythrin-like metal-binding protein